MKSTDFLVVGGGIAGTSAAEEIRSKDPNSSITILTEEPDRLYSRVLLPHYLRGENTPESLFVRRPESYTEKNINLATSTKVTTINTSEKKVTVVSGEEYSYKKLLIASGGKVNRLTTPGSDLPEVIYLRTLEDAKAAKQLISNAKEAVVLGGGFIGIEFAQSFVKNNLKTTAIIREKSFWETVVGENLGKFLSQILTLHGVNLITEAQVSEFVGAGKLEAVKLSNGSVIKTDLAGVGIGIHMELSHLQNSGLEISNGVVTNEFLETSVPGVWAAGDIAEFFDPVFRRIHQLGNWANASAQGRTVGLNMAGERIPFATTSMYSINIFEGNFSFLGDPTVDETTEVIERGSSAEGKLGNLLLRDDVVVGAALINMPLDRNHITKLIKNKVKITTKKEKLSDLGFDLASLI